MTYAKHLLIAWTGLFALGVLLAGTVPGLTYYTLDAPSAAPYFPGWIAIGLAAGFLINRRDRSPAACWVFVPPLLLFLLDALQTIHRGAPYGGWSYYLSNTFSPHCTSDACAGEALLTAPLYATIAYSIGSLIALRGLPLVKRRRDHAPDGGHA